MCNFQTPDFSILRLQTQLKEAGLPIKNVRIAKDLTIDYDWLEVPTEAQFQLASEILAAHDPKDTKTIPDLSTDEKIEALKREFSEKIIGAPIAKEISPTLALPKK